MIAENSGSDLAVATVGVSAGLGESVAPAAADLLLVDVDRLRAGGSVPNDGHSATDRHGHSDVDQHDHDETHDTPVAAVDDWPGEAGVAAVEAGLAIDWLPAALLESEPATARNRLRSPAATATTEKPVQRDTTGTPSTRTNGSSRVFRTRP